MKRDPFIYGCAGPVSRDYLAGTTTRSWYLVIGRFTVRFRLIH